LRRGGVLVLSPPKWGVLAAALALILLESAAPANADLVIIPTFDRSITSDPNAAAIESTINTAISTYESLFTNPITVKIYFSEMSSGLGESFTGVVYNTTYQGFRNALNTQYGISGNANQGTAVANLPNTLNNPVSGTTVTYVTPADGRALGFNTPGVLNSQGQVGNGAGFIYDGAIGLNTAITFPPGPNNGSNYSLLAVTEHEIDEVLGTGSFVGFASDPRAEDLYRFEKNSTTRNYTTSGDNAWFSIDGGTTDLVQFNQAGGGSDYGDWHTSSTARVQNAFGTPGATPTILNDGGVELAALNVLGYDLATPEPASLALVAAGGLLLSGYDVWRRKRKPTGNC